MKSDYDRVNEIGGWKTRLLLVSTFFTLFLTLNEKYSISKKYNELEDYIHLIIGINTVLIVVYVILEIRENYIFSKAERNRRLQYLDNSFDTNFSGNKIEGYFSQDKLNPGFYKLCMNCFENTYHSFNIAKEMQVKTYFKAGAIIAVFIFSAAVGEKGIVRTLLEAILPLALVQNAFRLSIFVGRLDNLLDSFKVFFNSISSNSFTNREPEALKNVISYETTLAWASMPLNNSIFLKRREKLSQEWEELKLLYNIK